MTKRHTCLFFSSMIFLSFKGSTNEVFSLISLTMFGHAKKTTDTTFTIFYNQDTLAGYRQCKLSSLLYFVVSLAAGLSETQVVIRCTCCFSCFPYISKKAQQRRAAFPEKAAAKSCSLLFPFQQACLSSQVVIRCTCCFSCFPYISKKTQQGRAAFPEKAAAKVVLCCFPCSRLV